jgi:hypothetical protein
MRDFTRFTVCTLTSLAFCLLFAGCAQQRVKRYGNVIGLRPEKLEEYKELHANVWPGVLKMIKERAGRGQILPVQLLRIYRR